VRDKLPSMCVLLHNWRGYRICFTYCKWILLFTDDTWSFCDMFITLPVCL